MYNENNLNLGKHCGKKTGETTLVTGDYAVLTFHADETEQSKGFLLLFATIPEGKLDQKTDKLFKRKKLLRKEDHREDHSNIKMSRDNVLFNIGGRLLEV